MNPVNRILGKYPIKDKWGKSRELPIIKIGRKRYFVDARLNELRNVNDPNDSEKMEASEEYYIQNFSE
jgi:hypothetical protein